MTMRRHSLALADERAWQQACAACPTLDADAAPLVLGWMARGWPVMIRRLSPGDPPDMVPVGLPLPPAFGKRRLAFHLPPDSLRSLTPPALLSTTAPDAPTPWQETIDALLRLGTDCAAPPRVFGALLWQHLTGLAYLGPHSDLDLLWTAPPDRLPGLLSGLARLDATAPMRLDGEILGAGDVAANWRELSVCGLDAPVLLKTMARARLGVFPAEVPA